MSCFKDGSRLIVWYGMVLRTGKETKKLINVFASSWSCCLSELVYQVSQTYQDQCAVAISSSCVTRHVSKNVFVLQKERLQKSVSTSSQSYFSFAKSFDEKFFVVIFDTFSEIDSHLGFLTCSILFLYLSCLVSCLVVSIIQEILILWYSKYNLILSRGQRQSCNTPRSSFSLTFFLVYASVISWYLRWNVTSHSLTTVFVLSRSLADTSKITWTLDVIRIDFLTPPNWMNVKTTSVINWNYLFTDSVIAFICDTHTLLFRRTSTLTDMEIFVCVCFSQMQMDDHMSCVTRSDMCESIYHTLNPSSLWISRGKLLYLLFWSASRRTSWPLLYDVMFWWASLSLLFDVRFVDDIYDDDLVAVADCERDIAVVIRIGKRRFTCEMMQVWRDFWLAYFCFHWRSDPDRSSHPSEVWAVLLRWRTDSSLTWISRLRHF